MPVHFCPDNRTFFLTTEGMSYAMKILPHGRLVHLYWGAELMPQDLDFSLYLNYRAFSPAPDDDPAQCSSDTLPLEYPAYGTGDFRSPAIEILQPHDGSRILDLRYSGHQIIPGKPKLQGLPATFAAEEEAETLTITMTDVLGDVSVELRYTIFSKIAALARSARILNRGENIIQIRRALSCSVDFAHSRSRFHFLHLSGAWARERDIFASALRPGVQSIESRRGASSHQHNPFFALTECADSEDFGEAFGFNLVYSGNFLGLAELDSHESVRAQLGVNPFDFSWNLSPGDAFQTPEATLVYSSAGLGSLSRSYHRLYRDHLCRGERSKSPRPILVNNWEATGYDFDAEKLEALARSAAGLGIELFVLDDGWFGQRNSDRTSLGDWVVNERKLPGGLSRLATRLKGMGMDFGLWFEPEMVSPESELYQKHPDWCLHVPGRERTLSRFQLVLDFSRPEVREAVYRQMERILRTVPVSYVKWDMNRNLTEIGSADLPPQAQQEAAHRYMLGLYQFMERMIQAFPHILFEGCSGGGGRFDPGMLYYMPQIWTSDNSDAISRLRIQYGTSVVYPWSSIAAHVSAVPNHQVGRVTSFQTRGHVALTGAFGLELDIGALSDGDRAELRRVIEIYRDHRGLLCEGDFYRLRSPFRTNEAAWMIVSRDQLEALVVHVSILAQPNSPQRFLSLKGLNPAGHYRIAEGKGAAFRGDALMRVGLPLPPREGDFVSSFWHLQGASTDKDRKSGF